MLHISIATSLAGRFTPLLVAQPRQYLHGERWYAQLVPLSEGEMILVLEPNTRYCLVFHGLKKGDFKRFPKLLRQRLILELIELCQLSGADVETMADIVNSQTKPMQFGIGLDYTIAADISQISRHLQSIISELGGYPVGGLTQSDLGAKLNLVPQRGTDLALTPRQLFSNLWSERLLSFKDQERKRLAGNTDNVIPFDRAAFRHKRLAE